MFYWTQKSHSLQQKYVGKLALSFLASYIRVISVSVAHFIKPMFEAAKTTARTETNFSAI